MNVAVGRRRMKLAWRAVKRSGWVREAVAADDRVSGAASKNEPAQDQGRGEHEVAHA